MANIQSQTYTAKEDCFIVVFCNTTRTGSGANGYSIINAMGQNISSMSINANTTNYLVCFAKKGEVLTITLQFAASGLNWFYLAAFGYR